MARDKGKPTKNKPGKGEEAKGSLAKIQGFLGIIALAAGNVVAILTRIDEIGKRVSKLLGAEWAYRLHGYIVYGASALLLVGYASLTYWLYRNFVAQRTGIVRTAFFATAFVAILTTVGGDLLFLAQTHRLRSVAQIAAQSTCADDLEPTDDRRRGRWRVPIFAIWGVERRTGLEHGPMLNGPASAGSCGRNGSEVGDPAGVRLH
jgi:hypothetical protein